MHLLTNAMVDRVFRRTMGRSMLKVERRWLHLKTAPLVKFRPQLLYWDIRWREKRAAKSHAEWAFISAFARDTMGLCPLLALLTARLTSVRVL